LTYADVSVIVPAYNAASLLPDALDSIYAQTIQPYEVIVVDDASTDATRDICATYEQTHQRFIALAHRENLGIGATRQHGVEAAHGNMIAFLSHDDVWHPTFLEASLRTGIQQYGTFTSYFHWYPPEQRKTRFTPPEDSIQNGQFQDAVIQWALRKNMFVMFSAILLPRHWFDVVAFCPELRYGEDLIFLLDTLCQGMPWRYVPDALVDYRVHPHQATVSRPSSSYEQSWYYIADRCQKLGVMNTEIQHAYDQWRHQRSLRSRVTRKLRRLWA
jgi:glycosyltransferase involved in cell wall biosynthesis